MRFLHPGYLALGLVVLWLWQTGRARGIPARLRCVVGILLVLGIGGLQIYGGRAPLSVMFVLDSSDSMAGRSSSALSRVNRLAAGAARGDRAGLVVFGAQPALERRLEAPLAVPRIASQIVGSGTDISAALRLARAALPRDGYRRIVLVSDGRESTGHASAEAALTAADGIALDVAVPDAGARASAEKPTLVTHVSAPPAARVGEPYSITAGIEGPSGTNVEILLTRDADSTVRRRIVIPQSGLATAVFTDQRKFSGVYQYRVSVRGAGAGGARDEFAEAAPELGAVVAVSGAAQVLYVSATDSGLAAVLRANGFSVAHVRPSLLPRVPNGLAGYDAVVLDDVPATALDTAQASAIARHVREQGAGLLVLGGPRSLDAASVAEGPLGPLLPIDLRPRSGQRAPAMAIVLVFDKSGSMADPVAGVPKIELARQAVGKVFGVVPATDAVGVIAFDGSPIPIAQLSNGHDPAAVADRLRALEPGGATAIAPAVSMAGEWLRAPSAAPFSKRHVLLISDGRSTPSDAARLEAAVRGRGFELSVVALGADSDRGFLGRLASASGGRAYFPEDLRDLPLIVAREAARVSGGRAVEEPFVLRSVAHPVLNGIDRDRLPRMGGYVVSASKPTAETILRSHLGDPILSGWRAGLGKVVVFTADLRGSWSAELRRWNQASLLWVQAVRWLARATDDGVLDATFTEDNGSMQVAIDAQEADGRLLNLLDARAQLRTPSGRQTELALRSSAPGQYTVTIPLTEPGAHVVSIAARDPETHVEHRVMRGFYWAAAAERPRGVDRNALAALAAAGHGRVLDGTRSPFTDARPSDYRDVWPWLTGLALLLFVGDIVFRRTNASMLATLFSRRRRRTRHTDRNAA